MKLTQTRPEKSEACTLAVHAMREALVSVVIDQELNHAEALSATAHVFASILAGAYRDTKNQEAVLSAIPDVVRAYIPHWQGIYARMMPDEATP